MTPERFRSHVEVVSKRNDLTITIDDGVPSVYETAFAILREYEVSATIFVATEAIGKTVMTVEQIREMSEAGCDIQSHSHTHSNHFRLSRREIEEEGQKSKTILEQITGKPVYQYAFPYGAYSVEMCNILSSIGYTKFFTSDSGINVRGGPSFKIYDRINIFSEEDIEYCLRQEVSIRLMLRSRMVRLFLKIFGDRNGKSKLIALLRRLKV